MTDVPRNVQDEFNGTLDRWVGEILAALRKRFGLTTKKLNKRKKLTRLSHISFETPKNYHYISLYAAVLARGFRRLQLSVAQQLRAHKRAVAKADQTREELLAEAQAIVDALDLDVLQTIVEELTKVGIDVSTDAAILAIAQFGGTNHPDIIDHIDERSVAWAGERAAELIGMRYNADGNLVQSANAEMRIDESTRNMVRESIAEGLAMGDRIDEIATDLGDLYAFSEDRASLIANTEVRRAQSEGSLMGYRTASKDLNIPMLKEWLTAEDPCEEICLPNKEQGPIPLDDVFESGDDAPPGHPNCRCGIAPVVEGEEDDAMSEEE